MLAVGRLALIRPHSTKSVQFAARGASFGGRTVCVRQFSPAATSACSPLSRRGAVRQLVVYATQANKQRGHQAPMSTSAPDPAVVRLREHQQSAPRQTFPDECKTLVDLGRYGVLSTISKEYDGHPNGSIVGFASDDKVRLADVEMTWIVTSLLTRGPGLRLAGAPRLRFQHDERAHP